MAEDLKGEFKRVYSIYASNKDEISSMNEGLAEQTKVLAKVMGVKPGILNKSFANLYRLSQSGVDEAAEISNLLEEMQGTAEVSLDD